MTTQDIIRTDAGATTAVRKDAEAVIEQRRPLPSTIAAYDAAFVLYGDASSAEDVKSTRATRAALAAAERALETAQAALLAYEPSTLAEVAMLAPYYASADFGAYGSLGNTNAEWLSRQICRFAGQPEPPTTPQGGDGELHAMLAEHKAIWAEAEAAPLNTRTQERANDRRWRRARKVLDRIAEFLPTTAADLAAKAAHVLAWAEYTGCPGAGADLGACEEAAASVIRDTIRLCGTRTPPPHVRRAWDIALEAMNEQRETAEAAGCEDGPWETLAERQFAVALLPAPDLAALVEKFAGELDEEAALGLSLDEALAARLAARDWPQEWPVLVFLDLLALCQQDLGCPAHVKAMSFPMANRARLERAGITEWEGGFAFPHAAADPLAMIAGVARGPLQAVAA